MGLLEAQIWGVTKDCSKTCQKSIDEAVEKMTALEAEAANAWGFSLAKDKS
jgi:hypothetical protein